MTLYAQAMRRKERTLFANNMFLNQTIKSSSTCHIDPSWSRPRRDPRRHFDSHDAQLNTQSQSDCAWINLITWARSSTSWVWMQYQAFIEWSWCTSLDRPKWWACRSREVSTCQWQATISFDLTINLTLKRRCWVDKHRWKSSRESSTL